MPPRGLGSNLLVQKLLEAVSLASGQRQWWSWSQKTQESALGWRSAYLGDSQGPETTRTQHARGK